MKGADEHATDEYADLTARARCLRFEIFDDERRSTGYHFGGALSCAEILVSLYKRIFRPEDAFIMSKGHAAFAWYPLLREQGYNPELKEHPDMDVKNGILCTTGSLGHGLPQGAGIAFARKLKNRPGRVYVLMGEGEFQEGTAWEALMFARHHCLDNLVGILDMNGAQGSGRVDDILSLGREDGERIEDKIRAFGAHTEVVDGHSFAELIPALQAHPKERPLMIIARTVKGKGVPFMEEDASGCHARYPSPEQMRRIYENCLGVPYKPIKTATGAIR